MWEGETVVRRCDSFQGDVKGVRNLFQLMERYDGHGGDVRGVGTCDSESSVRWERYRQVCYLMEIYEDHRGGEHWLGEV